MESSLSIITASTNSNKSNDTAPPHLKKFKTEDSSLPAEAVHGCSVHSGDVVSTLPIEKSMARSAGRISKELTKFQRDADSIGVQIEIVSDKKWNVKIKGVDGTLYQGENFVLSVQFDDDYPYESPIIKFVGEAPIHPHIYSNGHICLDLLYENWSPAVTIQTVALSIQSMLSSNTVKIRPPDNDAYSRRNGAESNPKKTRFAYHDDSV